MHELVLPEKNLSKDRRSQQKDLQKYKMCRHRRWLRAEPCDSPPKTGSQRNNYSRGGAYLSPPEMGP